MFGRSYGEVTTELRRRMLDIKSQKKGKNMAKNKNVILGAVAGTLGELIGSSWNGISYFRARPTSYHDAKTPSQMNNRKKMVVTQKFLKAITPYLRIGFRNYAVGQSAYNAAASYVRNNALLVTEDNVSIDPAKVLVSRGILPGANTCAAKATDGNTITFSWDGEELQKSARHNDFAMPMVYNLSKMEAKYSIQEYFRKEGEASFSIPGKWIGDSLSCFIAFASQRGKAVSNSEYLGEICL